MNKITHLYKKFSAWMHFNPPGALTGEGWYSFRKEFKSNAPIRYFIAHDLVKKCVYPIKWKYESISDWVRYRTYDRYHIVNTGLEPRYYERDTLMLHVNFSLLVDYVECGLAWKSYWTEQQPDRWKREHIPFYNYIKPLRRPDLGLKHLAWESTLDDPSLPAYEQSPQQAKRAREVLKLYDWWKNIRPARKEIVPKRPDGSDDFFSLFGNNFKNTPEGKAYMRDLKRMSAQEAKWDKEDDAMLIRLMKIRRGLWS